MMSKAEQRYQQMFPQALSHEFEMLKILHENAGKPLAEVMTAIPLQWSESCRNRLLSRLVRRPLSKRSNRIHKEPFFFEREGRIWLDRKQRDVVEWLVRA